MEILLGILTILVVSAIIVDWLLRTISSTGVQSAAPPADAMTNAKSYQIYRLTTQFVELFYSIYGRRAWTWRRAYRSVVLSLLFIFYSYLIVGTEHSVLTQFFLEFGFAREPTIFFLLSMIFVANLVADFVSVEETRWVMETVKEEPANSSFITWVCVDLLLTTFIYFLFVTPVLFVGIFLVFGLKTAMDTFSSPNVLNVYVDPDFFLPLFVSTYGTSIVWYIFVAFAFVGKIMTRRSRVIRVGWNILLETGSPARLVAVLIGMALGIFFYLVKGIQWLLVLLDK